MIKVLVVSPPMPKHLRGYRWFIREHNCSQVRGDPTNPCLALSIINSILETNVANVKFYDLQLKNIDKNRFLNEINSYKPDIIVTLLSAYAIQDDKWYAEVYNPTISVITPTTVKPIEAVERYGLKSRFFTSGDTAENSIHDAIKELFFKGKIEHVKGLVIRKDDGLYYEGDCASRKMPAVPIKAHDVINFNDYPNIQKREKTIYLYTSKGCHYQCIYCTVGAREYEYIGNTADEILHYIRYLVNRYGVKKFLFSDADFIADRERTLAFANGLINSNLKISYSINCTINRLNRELVDSLRASGCSEIRIGIETVNKKLLAYLRKGYDIRKAIDVVKYAIDSKMDVLLYFTTGIPGETKLDIMENINFLLETGASKFTNGLLFPIPSTSLYNSLKSEGKLVDKDWSEYYLGSSLHFVNESYKSLFRIKLIQWWMRIMYRIQKTFGKCETGTFKYYICNMLAEVGALFLNSAFNMYRILYHSFRELKVGL